jgi:succinoglycan biosynthesis transport protein ExoP
VELREFIGMLRASWAMIVTLGLVGTALAVVIMVATPTVYRSSTQLYVAARPVDGPAPFELAQGVAYVRESVASFAGVATSTSVLVAVIDELGLPTTAEELAEHVDASVPPDTVLLTISAEDGEPEGAALIAAAVSKHTVRVLTEHLGESWSGATAIDIRTVSEATAPSRPIDRDLAVALALGLTVGLGAGLAAASVRHAWRAGTEREGHPTAA